MKTNKLSTKLFLTILSLAGLTAVNAQTWIPTAPGTLYANPTTTKIGIGTTTPSYGLHLLNTNLGIIKGANSITSDGSSLIVSQSQAMPYPNILTTIYV